jgi:two-component system, OmpR family, alkaline phosphatase synthesis response regulator PhoP
MSVKKILTVSDTPVMQRFLQYNLTERGYQVTSTPNNRGQLKTALYEELPDMVILDVVMPTMEGIELCLYIKQQFDIPILVLSACGPRSTKFRGVDLHADDYLTEPFGILDLVTRIDDVVSSNA